MPPLRQKTIALDTETTGVDWAHGAMPFLVTTCQEDGSQSFWEWEVDPVTRVPNIPQEDIEDIRLLIESASILVGQNSRFDAKALSKLRVEWPWSITQDTLMAGHLLNTSQPHDLTSMCLHYLGVDIQPYEDAVQVATQKARRIARSQLKHWRIAKKGDPMMPSVRGSDRKKKSKGVEEDTAWKLDMWLPRAIAKELGYEPDHPWWTVTSDYANADSLHTIQLWKVMEKELKRR